jgi:dipeptidyl aminopeptidase/acylaminoacyl peptidase
MLGKLAVLSVGLMSGTLLAAESKPFDAAAAFGARQSISSLSLSPDGTSVAYLAPSEGAGTALYTLRLEKDAQPRLALVSNGHPDRINRCFWVAHDRLACEIFALVQDPTLGFLPISRVVAIDADGGNVQWLSRRDDVYSHGFQLGGGSIIDLLPEEDGSVLMTRRYVPDDRIGTRFGSKERGLGVDHIDTRSVATKPVEPPNLDTVGYITDGLGNVRIAELEPGRGNPRHEISGTYEFMYRAAGSREWKKLSEFNVIQQEGFAPAAINPDSNLVYGFKKKDGRIAVYSRALDDSLREELVYANPEVDVDEIILEGRRRRAVGVEYITDRRQAEYFSPQMRAVVASMSKALPQAQLLRITDTSTDESRMLIFAASDSDAGVYYILDRKTHQLQTFLVVRKQLEGIKLANVRAISYPAADGVMVPGYLTLPHGLTDAKGLPAIVLPPGGQGARDEWGFDWLSQFFAARGFAVLQPNFRGNTGYAEAWFIKNGFQSWQVAIGDMVAAGHWLVSQGIADPAKLGIFGWGYGGYAALQSSVVEPTLFKAVVAVAPITDLASFKQESLHWTNHDLVGRIVGDGAHVKEGSPAEHADRIKAPMLLFHGSFDRNVRIEESELMCSRLQAAGGKCELVKFQELDHYLEDSGARAQMLGKSDAFLRAALGM